MNRSRSSHLIFVASLLLVSWPVFSLDCTVAIHCDEQRLRCECARGMEGGYCASSGDMIMMLSCERAEGKEGMVILGPQHMGSGRSAVPEPDFQFLPVFFPPSNARLDEHFSRYMEFVAEAYQQADLKGYNYLWGNGGMIIDHRPYQVEFTIGNEGTTKRSGMIWTTTLTGQHWKVNVMGYGRVEMRLENPDEHGEIRVKYIRAMANGSYTESNYAYLFDGISPRPVILDPSHSPKE